MTEADPQKIEAGIPEVFLEPGALYCTTKPVVVRTVLGSCVGVCLVDRYFRAAGMNHFVLPINPEGPPSLRYGDVAIEQLIQKMRRLGCDVSDLQAKVFGGAAVLPFGTSEDTVGTKNVTIALEMLRANAISVVARRTGGENGLLVLLHTATGGVMIRPIAASGEKSAPGRIATYDSQAGCVDQASMLRSQNRTRHSERDRKL